MDLFFIKINQFEKITNASL
jgi:hypothetical protein